MGDFLLSVTSYLTGIRLPYFTWSDIVEILLIAFFVYEFMLWIRNTRAYSLLKGILIVACIYFHCIFIEDEYNFMAGYQHGRICNYGRIDYFSARA